MHHANNVQVLKVEIEPLTKLMKEALHMYCLAENPAEDSC